MIIKLQGPYGYARHKEGKVTPPVSRRERINADRVVMLILLAIAIVTAIIFA